jgi:uncharacterized membrane protein
MGPDTFDVRDVNDSAQAAGVTVLSTTRAWVWQDGARTVLPDPGGSAFAMGINNLGDVAGKSGRAGYWRGSDRRFVTLGVDGIANAINDRGQAAGTFFINEAAQSFFYDPEQGLKVIAPATAHGVNEAFDINNGGTVIGTMNFGSYRWDATHGLVGLGGMAAGINDRGQIVGSSNDQPVLWEANLTMRTLPLPPGGTGGAAREVNEAGQVVGTFIGSRRGGAFLWEGGTSYELLDLVVNPEGWTSLRQAWSINNHGQIVGQGVYQADLQGFILTPVPEPAAAGAALLLITVFVGARPLKGRHP